MYLAFKIILIEAMEYIDSLFLLIPQNFQHFLKMYSYTYLLLTLPYGLQKKMFPRFVCNLCNQYRLNIKQTIYISGSGDIATETGVPQKIAFVCTYLLICYRYRPQIWKV